MPNDGSSMLKDSSDENTEPPAVELYDYILVFNNPFDSEKKGYKCKLYDYDVSSEKAEIKFRRFFNISEDESAYKEAADRIRSHIDGKTTIKMQILVQEFLLTTLKIFQDYLQLDVTVTLSLLGDKFFFKLISIERNLKVQADLVDYQLQFQPHADDDLDFQKVPPYGPYERDAENKGSEKVRIYKRYDNLGNETPDGSIFKHKDRIRLVYSMISSVIELGELTTQKILDAQFPQHDHRILTYFDKEWVTFRHFWRHQNIEKINDYFGEKQSMYFAWLENYIWWLTIPSIFGSIFGIIIYSADSGPSDSINAGEVCYFLYAFLLSIGSTFMDQIWLRKEKVLGWKWGVCDIKGQEEQRPEYKGVYQKDPISGKMKKIHEKKRHSILKNVLGLSTIIFFVTVVIASLIAIFFYRANSNDDSWGPRIAGIFNAIQIKILNIIYKKIAVVLTDWENYETESEYQNALTIKLFAFQFVNSYSSLFYIAYFKGRYEGCESENCVYELGFQLGIIYIITLCLNLIEIGLPIFQNYINLYKENKKIKENDAQIGLSAEEIEYNLIQYETPLDDYMEVIIGYGYVVLFGISFPFSPLLTLFLCIIELRVDAWKLIKATRRIFPAQESSIGVWIVIIQIISFIGAGTNMGLITFTRNVFHLNSAIDQWICFIALEHSLFILKMILSVFIPNVPGIVENGIKWSTRVRGEILWGKLSDIDKEREARNLVFEPLEYKRKYDLIEIADKTFTDYNKND
ncbi:unnamed protein product [Blepharisma stoltei]|uniref:Anoctamin transmembrane domain-containing protein n=1 Tax=Blepharisma stoltei TaxID=1481888 RepID=A0AAU9IF17_9CILI|nr:unnamed protein product [Blepharisma stoltei]